MKSADDDWEELRLSTFCDASFGTRVHVSEGTKVKLDVSEGTKVKLAGSRGSSFLIEWASLLQGPQFNSFRINRVGMASHGDAARQRMTGC